MPAVHRWHIVGWYLLIGGSLNVLLWLVRWQGVGKGLGGLALTLVAAPILILVPPGPGAPGTNWGAPPPDVARSPHP